IGTTRYLARGMSGPKRRVHFFTCIRRNCRRRVRGKGIFMAKKLQCGDGAQRGGRCRARRGIPRRDANASYEEERMQFLAGLRQDWRKLTYYERFEQFMLHVILLFVSVISVFVLGLVTIQLVNDFQLGQSFLDKAVLQDTFGSI